jgi:hypothetical protein
MSNIKRKKPQIPQIDKDLIVFLDRMNGIFLATEVHRGTEVFIITECTERHGRIFRRDLRDIL